MSEHCEEKKNQIQKAAEQGKLTRTLKSNAHSILRFYMCVYICV